MALPKSSWRRFLAWSFVCAGALHFTNTAFYLRIMPPMFPAPLALVWISGGFEILGGFGLMVPRCRRAAGYGLIALLVAVLPVHTHMLAEDLHTRPFSFFTVLLILRIPLQALFVVWVNLLSKE